jgi:hypothetical protein
MYVISVILVNTRVSVPFGRGESSPPSGLRICGNIRLVAIEDNNLAMCELLEQACWIQ